MKLNQHLKDWKQIVSQRFPHLSSPQISGLATGSFGMVMTQPLQPERNKQLPLLSLLPLLPLLISIHHFKIDRLVGKIAEKRMFFPSYLVLFPRSLIQ